jgi:TP901 family phage tail tape measure protein
LDFTSSITLQFNDLFSSGFAQARQSVIDLKTSLDGIGAVSLDGIVPQSLPQPDIPQPVIPSPALPELNIPHPVIPEPLFMEGPGGVSMGNYIPQSLPPPIIPAPALPESPIPAPVVPEPGIPKQRRTPKSETPPLETGPFTAGLTQIKSGLDKIGQNSALNTVATQLSVMANMTAPLRNSLSGMMNEPSRLAGTFESSMKNIQAITDKSSGEINILGKELNRIGGKSAAGPLAVADAFNDVAGGIAMVSPGVEILDVQMQVLTNALALAEAGQANLGVATNGLVKIMNSYNFTTGDVAEVNERAAWASDVMTQAVSMGVGTMNEFVSAMAPVSGKAASVGVGFDEVGATMAYMTANTDTAATAGTKLESFMTALQKPSDSLAEALAKVGITSGSAMLAEYGLAASAQIVSDAFGGNQDAITQAMGRQEAANAVVSLTADTYKDFASAFGSTMSGITERAQAVQTQSYESKLARLQAASSALKITTGQDINIIKGFFVDMGAGFLTHVVNPIASSPVGGVFRGIAAVAGIGAQGLLSLGSGALNTAAQLSVLAANVKNFEGYKEMFRGALSVMGTPLKTLGSGIARLAGTLAAHVGTMITQTATTFTATAATSGYAAAMWGAAGATWAVVWPVLEVVAAVALVALGVYAIIKNWSTVSSFFTGLWNKITNVFTIAVTWLKGFFGSLWGSLWNNVFKEPVMTFVNWAGGIWSIVVSAFTQAWGYAAGFFRSIWDHIVSIVLIVANWFGSVWAGITGGFSAAWGFVGTLFSSIWEGIKGTVLGFVEWLSPVIDVILAPFRWIGNVVGGIISKVGGWLGDAVDAGNAAVAELSKDVTTELVQTVTGTVTPGMEGITPPPTETVTSSVTSPSFGEPIVPPDAFTAPEFSSTAASTMVPAPGSTPVSQTFTSFAAPAGIGTPEMTYTASSAFSDAMSAALIPHLDMSALERQVDLSLPQLPQAPAFAQPGQQPAAPQRRTFGPPKVTIKNLYVQAEDMRSAVDFYHLLMNAVHQPEEEPV